MEKIKTGLDKIKDLIDRIQDSLQMAAEEGDYWVNVIQEEILEGVDNVFQILSQRDESLIDCRKLMDKFHQEMKEHGDNEISRRLVVRNIYSILILIVKEGKDFDEVYFPTFKKM